MNDLERRQLAAVWEMTNLPPQGRETYLREMARIKARHGFAPDGTPVEKPATDGDGETMAQTYARAREEALRHRVGELLGERDSLTKERDELRAALEKKLLAWSEDHRTVRLCKLLKANGIGYDYGAKPTTTPKQRRGKGKGRKEKRGR